MNLISEHGYRKDGRKAPQIRNISSRMAVYSQADGSAYFEQGNTKVLCAVYGPHEARQRSRVSEDKCLVNCQYSMATFSTVERKLRPRGDRRSSAFTRILERTFGSVLLTNLYPRSQIDIFCEVLQADGGHLAACINAATLALADAGVPMQGLTSAAQCGWSEGTVCMDLSAMEEGDMVPRVTVATVSGGEHMVLVELHNRIHHERLSQLLKAGRQAAAQVHSCLQAAVTLHVSSALQAIDILRPIPMGEDKNAIEEMEQ